jgi:hypothetical protein
MHTVQVYGVSADTDGKEHARGSYSAVEIGAPRLAVFPPAAPWGIEPFRQRFGDVRSILAGWGLHRPNIRLAGRAWRAFIDARRADRRRRYDPGTRRRGIGRGYDAGRRGFNGAFHVAALRFERSSTLMAMLRG